MNKALIGNGGHAREVQSQMGIDLIKFISDEYWIEGDDKVLPLSKFDPEIYEVMVAISNSNDRKKIVDSLPENTKYFTFIHPTTQLLSNDIFIGEGSFIGANSVITCNVKIGRHSILNRGNHIGHDCRIGDYFSAMPGSIVSGNVDLKNCVYLGTNSSIREKISVCSNVSIGLNSGVVKNINKEGVYVGTPCERIKSNKKIKLSVIIPCYNFEDYIENAILSALSQKTSFEFEILISDDKSTDNTAKIIERFSDSIRIMNFSQNLGAAKNIKKLIENCNGEYIAYLDGDDYWTDINKLQKQIEYMDSNMDCVMTFTGYWMKEGNEYQPDDSRMWMCLPNYYENGEVTTEQLVNINPGTFGRVFRNIDGLIKDWMLDTNFFDWVTNYELSKYGKLKYINFPSGVYRIHNRGTSRSLGSEETDRDVKNLKLLINSDYQNWICK